MMSFVKGFNPLVFIPMGLILVSTFFWAPALLQFLDSVFPESMSWQIVKYTLIFELATFIAHVATMIFPPKVVDEEGALADERGKRRMGRMYLVVGLIGAGLLAIVQIEPINAVFGSLKPVLISLFGQEIMDFAIQNQMLLAVGALIVLVVLREISVAASKKSAGRQK